MPPTSHCVDTKVLAQQQHQSLSKATRCRSAQGAAPGPSPVMSSLVINCTRQALEDGVALPDD